MDDPRPNDLPFEASPNETPPVDAPPAEPVAPPTAHEESDVDTGALGWFLAIMTVSLLIVGGLVYWQYRRFERLARANDPAPLPRADQREPPPPPHLQVNEVEDMTRLRDEQTALLHRTEWVDPQAKRVRIPIERAMEIVERDGLRRWPAPPAAAEETSRPMRDPKDQDQSAPETGRNSGGTR